MSRYFVLPEEGIGPGGDIIFRRRGHRDLLYVGEVLLGEVWHMPRTRWSGISNAPDSEFFGVHHMDGFASRMDAASFIIRHHGYWMHDERQRMRIPGNERQAGADMELTVSREEVMTLLAPFFQHQGWPSLPAADEATRDLVALLRDGGMSI